MDIDELRHIISSFSFEKCKGGSQGFKRILIQLFGMLGHGKSSFINTCIYVWQDGVYQNWAEANEDHGGSTLKRIDHKLTSNITVVDNRGLLNIEGHETGEIFAQLGNLLPLGRKVNWDEKFGIVERIVKEEKLVQASDFIFPVFIHSVKMTIPPEELEVIKDIFKTSMKLTGVFPIVALTHKTSGKLTETENIFRNMGVERIFSFENYTKEDHFKTRGRHEEVLKFLHEVIKDVQFRVERDRRDPVKEMVQRKEFVINYIHGCEKKAEQQRIENQKAMEKALLERKLKQQEDEQNRQRERERKAHAEEFKERQDELERQRKVEKARHEDELRAAQERKNKKKKKWGIFG